MSNRNGVGVCAGCVLVLSWILCVASVPAAAEQLTLKHAVDLALVHSTATGISTAEVQHAGAAYRETRDNYIPQLVFGSGLGKSWGFPLSLEGSAPSIFNVNAQSSLWNPALRQFVRAARTEWQATNLQNKDQRAQLIQDTVLSYAELNKWEQRLGRLQEEETAASKLEEAMTERVKEGIDSPVERTRARLSAARAHLRLVQAQGSADVLREHLAKLTGLKASEIETVPDSIPQMPAIPDDDADVATAAKNSPAALAAEERARAAYLRAQGEHKSLLPHVDFAGQYALLAKYNNYDVFYAHYQANNATLGVSIQFPFFSSVQHQHAAAADADAVRAKRAAEATRNQVSEETLRQQRSVREMAATQQVAQLEYEISQANLDATQTRTDAGTATIKDLGDARSQAAERFLTLQDVTFELERARIALLRSTGELEKWVSSGN
jgi:outer membrane protein TolC